MQKYSDVVLDKNGKGIAGATVTVTTYPDGLPATIYAADGGPAVTSVQTDNTGRFSFYAANGHYSIAVSGQGITPYTYNDVALWDSSDLAASGGAGLVGWIRTAAGTVKRFVSDKLSDTVHVKDFGAVGDGTTDDTAAIQTAINHVCAAGTPKKLIIGNGVSGVYKITAQLNIAGAITLEWENNNITLKKYFNGDMFYVLVGLTSFVNPGIDGNGATYTGGGIRYADGTRFTFDGSINNPRIANTADSCIIFNGPRGGSGIRITGGSLTPYNQSGISSAGPAGIRLNGPADNDATPRRITDVESSSSPLIDLTGMVTTFIKGGQCGTILFGGNPDVTGATFISAKAHITGVRVRDGLWIRGQDHAFAGNISHGYAPQYSSYGVITTPLNIGWHFNSDAQNCSADASNIVINKITDANNGLGDSSNKFFAINMGYTPQWVGSTTSPALGNGSMTGTYNVNGTMVDVSIFIQVGGTTTFGSGYWTFSLPYQASSATYRGAGNARSHNNGVADELGMALMNSSGNPSNITVANIANGINFSPTVPHTWKSGDYLEINFRYLRG